METAMKSPQHRTGAGLIRRQLGAYAVEYGLIFPVFFVLMYGTIAYGMIFAMRLGLQHAAEEGARVALRYPLAPPTPPDTQITVREAAAENAARASGNWIDALGSLTVKADVCLLTDASCLVTSSSTEQPDTLDCGETLTDGCQVIVTVEYPYSTHPIFPAIPGLGLIMPTRLQGRARAVIDGRILDL